MTINVIECPEGKTILVGIDGMAIDFNQKIITKVKIGDYAVCPVCGESHYIKSNKNVAEAP